MSTSDRALEGAVFDLDGVLTDSRRLHVAAWKEMLDGFLAELSAETGAEHRPFDADEEYRRFVDGKPRYEGLASFLAARRIELPGGQAADPPGRRTVCGLGNRKQEIFRAMLDADGVETIEPMLGLVRDLRRHGVAIAVATSSRNGRRIVEQAGIGGLFDAELDGNALDEEGLEGKPAPDMFVAAARRLGLSPASCALFEDSRAGVEAGRRGGFGLVVGVTEEGEEPAPLLAAGADLAIDRSRPPSRERLEAWLARRRGAGAGGGDGEPTGSAR